MVIKRKSFFDLYHIALDKILEQEADWFIKRIDYANQNNWQKVSEIEKLYLEPLAKKINKLSRFAREELKNEK